MKNTFTLLLMATLLLAGCAKQAAMDEQVINDPAPPMENHSPTPPVVVAEVEPTPDPVQTIIEAAVERVEKIYFDFDSHQLTPAGKEALQANALWLNAAPEIRILIEGHTDERGASTYNLALGEKRAAAARTYLQNLGIAAERINMVSYGEEQPAAAGTDEEAWAQNRRAEFVTAN